MQEEFRRPREAPLPSGFLERYQFLVDDFDAFVEYLNRPLPAVIRLNTLKAPRGEILDLLADLPLAELPWYENAFRVEGVRGLGVRFEHFLGLYYIQGASSMVPPLVLRPRPDERVLDMAAAPGSKATQLAQLMENRGLLVANDLSPKRARSLSGNLDRMGVLNAVMTAVDARRIGRELPDYFDRVLLDAPCTSEGTVRKTHEAIRRWSLRGIARMAVLQKGLIASAFNTLRPGGRLVYSTCTFAPEENEGVVDYLLGRFADAEVVPFELPGLVTRPGLTEWQDEPFDPRVNRCQRILPQDNDTEGFFVALIRRRGAPGD